MNALGCVVTVDELADHLLDPDWAIVDCRFSLDDPSRGERDYLAGHIAGAIYAHLERDLSAPHVPGRTGRHPLPDAPGLAERFGAWGIDADVTVVAYDDSAGAMAARLWWLLRWLGHEAAAVLDGGWQAWTSDARPVEAGPRNRPATCFVPRPQPDTVLDAAGVALAAADPMWRILDARASDRYQGLNETIDAVAGHIPGARSAPWMDLIDDAGRLRSPENLLEHYRGLLGDVPAERTVVYCGSGVTSSLHVLAMCRAGLGPAWLYAGSWSDWITDPSRPVATGTD